jgi:hypothetical protein
MPAACSSPRRTCACRCSASCCARATAWARRPWRWAASTRRCSPSRGRPANSAAWGWKAPCKLGYRKELEAAAGPEREALYQKLVARQYENGSAINMATTLEIDAVIDPADTRRWLVRGLAVAR